MLIKICGITSEQDAALAIESGADFIGLIFVERSPRHVTAEQARRIVRSVDGAVPCVGVFQNQPIGIVQELVESLGLDYAQFHGNEPMSDCAAVPVPVIRKQTLDEAFGIHRLAEAETPGNIKYWLLEPPKGTSLLSWSAPLPLGPEQVGKPSFLAGGLSPDNIHIVLSRYQPAGLDVASGVESAPGKKDPELLKQFCKRIVEWQNRQGDIACNL